MNTRRGTGRCGSEERKKRANERKNGRTRAPERAQTGTALRSAKRALTSARTGAHERGDKRESGADDRGGRAHTGAALTNVGTSANGWH
jgi:hypothetical protein